MSSLNGDNSYTSKKVLIEKTEQTRFDNLIIGRSGTRIFIIPPFQRNYDWEYKTCITLIKDLIKNINSEYAYYINQIVAVIRNGNHAMYDMFTLIDGQQRITTLLLILNAIKELSEDSKLKKYIENNFLYNNIDDEDITTKLKIQQTSDDSIIFEQIIRGNIEEQNKKSNMYVQYKYIYEYLKYNCYNQLHDLFNEIAEIRYTEVYISDNANYKDIQRIFEKMNSSGQELKASDLIRNNLLMPFENKQQKELYTKYWKNIEKNTEEDIEKFFRYFLICKTGNKIKDNSKNVYEEFVKYYDKEISNCNGKIEDIVKDIYQYSIWYFMIKNASHENKGISDAFARMNRLGVTAVYPLYMKLLSLNNSDAINYSSGKIIEYLLVIENYVVRRQLSIGYETKNYNEIFRNIYNRIISKYDDFTVETFKYGILEMEQNNKYPSDDEVKKGIKEKNIYIRAKMNPLAQLILERINHFSNIKESLGTKCIYEKFDLYSQKDESGYSIEHIMPKGNSDEEIQNSQWKQYLGNDANRIFSEWVNKLANLTITGYNSELGDMTFDKKREFYINSSLSINTTYFNAVNTWKENDIIKRNDYLTKMILEQIYKHLTSNYVPKVKLISFSDIESESIDIDIFGKIFKSKSIKFSVKCNDDYIVKKECLNGTDLYTRIIEFIWGKYQYKLKPLVEQSRFSELTIGEKTTKSAQSLELSDNIFLDKHGSTAAKFDSIIRIMSECEMNTDDIIFEFIYKDFENLEKSSIT